MKTIACCYSFCAFLYFPWSLIVGGTQVGNFQQGHNPLCTVLSQNVRVAKCTIQVSSVVHILNDAAERTSSATRGEEGCTSSQLVCANQILHCGGACHRLAVQSEVPSQDLAAAIYAVFTKAECCLLQGPNEGVEQQLSLIQIAPHGVIIHEHRGVAQVGHWWVGTNSVIAVHAIVFNRNGAGALVISPTRELAMQIYDVLRILSSSSWMVSLSA
eukprot:4395615-Amphidinium_carterae.1